MIKARPYIIRALHEWLMDIKDRPHIIVDCTQNGVVVPEKHEHKTDLVLNIHPDAAWNLRMGNELIQFNARFNTHPFAITVPVGAVLGIYGRETKQGMMFAGVYQKDDPEPPKDTKRPHLTVVK